MKHTKPITEALLVCALLTAGCVSENTDFSLPVAQEGTTGSLSLSAMTLDVVADAEIVPSSTRAVTAEDFTVDLLDDAQQVVRTFRYGDKPADPIEMEVGSYTLRASSGTPEAAAWESPAYSGSQDFAISKLETTELGAVVCRLSNVKVTVTYAADLLDLLGPGTVAEVAVDDRTLAFGLDERRAGYFSAAEGGSTLTMHLTGTLDGEPLDMTSRIEGAKAGQWRKIHVAVAHTSEGKAKIVVTVETWTLDEQITVDIDPMEEVIPDQPGGDAPAIEWPGHDLSEPFQLRASMFDEGVCTEPFAFTVAIPNAAAHFRVEIGSTNESFIADLEKTGIPTAFDLCEPGDAATLLSAMGFPVGDRVKGQTEVGFDLTTQMPLLYNFEGTHTFRFAVTDARELTTEQALTILVDYASETVEGPTIVWAGGYDFDTRYDVVADLTVNIEVAAPAGIKGFTVDIVSDTLTPEELQSAGLSDHIDLVNPGEMEVYLHSFGFPTGDAVRDQAEVGFDITDLVQRMLAHIGSGDSDFTLTVTDNHDAQTVRTLMLRVL